MINVDNEKNEKEGRVYEKCVATAEGSTVEISNPKVLADGALIVNIYYKRAVYTITYDPTAGDGEITTVTKKYGETITLKEAPTTLDDKQAFIGWNTKEDGTGTTYKANASYSKNGDVTLYAKWGQKVLVTYDANGGTVSTNSFTAIVGETYGSATTLEIPIKDGYKFSGWYTAKTGGTRVKSSTVVTNEEAHTLYAHWSAISIIDPTETTITITTVTETTDTKMTVEPTVTSM